MNETELKIRILFSQQLEFNMFHNLNLFWGRLQ